MIYLNTFYPNTGVIVMKKRNTIYPYMTNADSYNSCGKRNQHKQSKQNCKSNNIFYKLNFFMRD